MTSSEYITKEEWPEVFPGDNPVVVGNLIPITERLCLVMKDLPAIGKEQQFDGGGARYKYRGIEDIMPHVKHLFAEHGVVATPFVEDCQIIPFDVPRKDGTVARWSDTVLKVRYRFHSAGDTDDWVEAQTVGIGRDNSDKGANKAMTAAYKYALIQVLNISDFEDGDGERNERIDSPEDESQDEPKGIDWVSLGWHGGQLGHDEHLRQTKALIKDDAMRSRVGVLWAQKEFKPPLSKEDADEWRRIVEAEAKAPDA